MSGDDYKFRYFSLKKSIEKGKNQSDEGELSKVVGEIEEDLSKVEGSEDFQVFINTLLPSVIKELLDRKYFHVDNRVPFQVNGLFCSVLQFCIRHLSKDNYGCLEIIRKLLHDEKNFYDTRYTFFGYQIESALKEQWTKEFPNADSLAQVCGIQSSAMINAFFYYNLRFFAQIQGFDQLVKYIEQKPPIEHINQILGILINNREFMYHSAWKTIAKAAYRAAIAVCTGLSEEEVRVTQKNEFQKLNKSLDKILDRLYSDYKMGEILENYELDVAFKFLTCRFLEKRIYGITEINTKIIQAKNKDEEDRRLNRGVNVYRNFSDTAKWLDSAKLLNWIDNHTLFEVIFGSAAHPEIIKRSAELVKFLYANERLSRENIDLIWDSASARHEAHKDAVMTLIQDIASCLSNSDIHYFFTKIIQIPFPDIDNSCLQLVKSFVKQLSVWKTPIRHGKSSSLHDKPPDAVAPWEPEKLFEEKHVQIPAVLDEFTDVPLIPQPETTENKEETTERTDGFEATQALDYLWALFQEQALEAGVQKNVASQSRSILQDLLANYCRGNRLKYALKCLENIGKNTSVVSALKVLEAIISSYHRSRGLGSSSESRNHMIKQLERDHGLLSELYSSFLLFKMSAAETAQALAQEEKPDEDTRVDTYSTCSSGDEDEEYENRMELYDSIFKSVRVCKDMDLTYAEELRLRLDFFKFIYRNSSESLDPRHVQLLWDTMVIHAAIESDQVELFNWISGILNNWMEDYSVIDDDAIHYVFTELLLKLDPRYFILSAYTCFEKYFININRQHGLLVKYEFDEDLDVKDINLLGIQTVWEITLQTRDEMSFKASLGLLKKIYKGLKDWKPAVQEEFLQVCIQHIRQGADILRSGHSTDAVNRVRRALTMLFDFVKEFEGHAAPGETIEIIIKNTQLAEPSTCNMEIQLDMTVGELREAIASKLNLHCDSLQIITKGKVFDHRHNKKHLRDIKFSNKQNVTVTQSEIDPEFYDNDHPMPPPDELPSHKQEYVIQLSAIFQYEEPLLVLALEKANWSIDEAAEILMDDYQRENLNRQSVAKQPAPQPSIFQLSDLIANTREYFNLLFELLELGISSINSEIWNLLDKVPVNQELFQELRALEIPVFGAEPDWESVLDSTNVYKLYYCLQIVASFVSHGEGTLVPELSPEEKQQWRTKFLDLGGFRHLYRILMNSHPLAEPAVSRCFVKLLSIVKLFVQAALLSESCEDLQAVYVQDSLEPRAEVEDLPGLIRRMSEGASDHVLQEIDLDLLLGKLLGLFDSSLAAPAEATSLEIMQTGTDLMLSLLIYKPSLVPGLLQTESFLALVNSLLDCSNSGIRDAVKVCLTVLARGLEHLPDGQVHPKFALLDLFLERLPRGFNEYCDQFFEVLSCLVEVRQFSDPELMQNSIDLIESREMVEQRQLGNQDKVLAGFFTLAATLLTLMPEVRSSLQLFTQRVYNMLFEMPQAVGPADENAPPLCKHSVTRRAAFNLLLVLVRDAPGNAKFLLERLYSNHSDVRLQGSCDSSMAARGKAGKVGLRNFGSTCYMNSLLQQLFMMPQFRENFLNATIKSEDLEDDLVYQLQTVFCHLQESEKQYYAPAGFCGAFKGYDGAPLNVHVQQDVDEFFNLLCDKLEELMKGTPQAHLLRSTFGGSLTHEIVSIEEEYPYRSEREEHFMRISLDIKNKKSLAEALDLYIAEDILEGENKYHCAEYDQKIDAKKRCLIGSLSNTVFIHLKRFEFDFNTMQRYKVNEYCEFPTALNLKPWSKDGVLGTSDHPDHYYEFQLVGVLVHSGIADAGHYYSFIKDRVSQQWLRFDDRHVEVFDLANLKEECFGGESSYNWNYNQSFAKTKSAYMLVYERAVYVEAPGEETESGDIAMPEASENCTAENMQKVWADNMEFLQDLLFFDVEYIRFVMKFIDEFAFTPCLEIEPALSESENFISAKLQTDFIRQGFDLSSEQVWCDFEEERDRRAEALRELEERHDAFKLIKLATLFAYEILIKANNSDSFRAWLYILKDLYWKHHPSCLWIVKYLTSNRTILTEILLEHKDSEVRAVFADFLAYIIEVTCIAESDMLLQSCEIFGGDYTITQQMESATGRFFTIYLDELLSEARKNWRRFNEFFSVLLKFLQAGVRQCELIVMIGGLNRMIGFFMNGTDPFPEEKFVMGDPANDPDMCCVLDIIGVLAEMDRNKTYVMDPRVFKSLLKHIKHEAVNKLSIQLSWGNKEFSAMAMEEIMLAILNNKFQWPEINTHLKVLAAMLKLDDSLAEYRAEIVFTAQLTRSISMYNGSSLFEILNRSKESSSMFTVCMIVWLHSMMELPHMFDAVIQHRSKLRWIIHHIRMLNTRFLSTNIIYDYTGNMLHVNDALQAARSKLENTIDTSSESSVEVYEEMEERKEPENEPNEDASTDSAGAASQDNENK